MSPNWGKIDLALNWYSESVLLAHALNVFAYKEMGYQYRPVAWSELPKFLRADGLRLAGYCILG